MPRKKSPARRPAEPAKPPSKASAPDPEKAPECPPPPGMAPVTPPPAKGATAEHRDQDHLGAPNSQSTSTMLIRQQAVQSKCLRRRGRLEACKPFHHGRRGKEEVYPNQKLIMDKNNNDLYYQRRKEEFYLNKLTMGKDNNNLHYKKERDKSRRKEQKVNERKEGSVDKNKSKRKKRMKERRRVSRARTR